MTSIVQLDDRLLIYENQTIHNCRPGDYFFANNSLIIEFKGLVIVLKNVSFHKIAYFCNLFHFLQLSYKPLNFYRHIRPYAACQRVKGSGMAELNLLESILPVLNVMLTDLWQ